MDDSTRLGARLSARAARPRLVGEDAAALVLKIARKHATDPANIRPATDAEMAEAEARLRRERRETQVKNLLARLPARYREFEIPRTTAGALAQRWVRDYVAGDRNGLVIMGNVGTGKTALAAAIVRTLLVEHLVPSTMITVAEFLDALRPTAGTKGMDVDMIHFQATPVLVLDDLGAEVMRDWGKEQLYRLAHARSHNGLPTIVTTNLEGPDLHNLYDERTLSRLCGGSRKIGLTGESRRPMPF